MPNKALPDDATAALAAALCYNYGQFGLNERPKQDLIAEMLSTRKRKMYRSEVSELITHAEKTGMVRFEVTGRGGRDQISEELLKSRIRAEDGRQLLNETAVRVVQPTREISSVPVITWEVAQAAAELLRKVVEEKAAETDVIVGVSLGRTLRVMAELVRAIRDPGNRVHVVPTVGGFGGDLVAIESASIAREICRRLGTTRCDSYSLPVPGFVTSPDTQDALLELPLTEQVVKMWNQAHILVSGVGSMDPSATSLSLWKAGAVNEQDLRLLQRHADAAGDLAFHFISHDGKPISEKRDDRALPQQVREVIERISYPVAISLECMRDVAEDSTRYSVAVGAGVAKAPAYVAALRGPRPLLNGIVTDSATAEEILRLWDVR